MTATNCKSRIQPPPAWGQKGHRETRIYSLGKAIATISLAWHRWLDLVMWHELRSTVLTPTQIDPAIEILYSSSATCDSPSESLPRGPQYHVLSAAIECIGRPDRALLHHGMLRLSCTSTITRSDIRVLFNGPSCPGEKVGKPKGVQRSCCSDVASPNTRVVEFLECFCFWGCGAFAVTGR